MSDETHALAERYSRRNHGEDSRRYSLLSPANWQTVQERQRAMLRLFARLGFDDLARLRLVEVGAGSGANLLELLRLGFAPEHLTGIELLKDRAVQAQSLLPASLRIVTGDARSAAIPEASVDVVYQAVVFSSLLDDRFQEELAASMWRWVRPGGGVLWYDFAVDNPANPDVRGVPIRRVRELFPHGVLRWRRVTLAPPLARRVASIHPALYTLCNSIPYLRTHRLCWIAKP